jgi:hypothetical protein
LAYRLRLAKEAKKKREPCKKSEKKSVTVAPNLAKKAKKKSGAQNKYPRWELNH